MVINCDYATPSIQGTPIVINLKNDSFTTTLFDVSSLFKPLKTACPITNYKIESIKSKSGQDVANFRSIISISNKGVLTLLDQTPREKHLIYVQATSGISWSNLSS